jgi:DNA-directed RNA polymerase subunit RPC12/RpoP
MKTVRIVMAAALFAIVGVVAAMPVEIRASESRKEYGCPACGMACDQQVYGEPGTCPACGMRLVEKVDRKDELVPGKAAPDFSAIDQNGKALKLSDYMGKVVVLDFWEHW